MRLVIMLSISRWAALPMSTAFASFLCDHSKCDKDYQKRKQSFLACNITNQRHSYQTIHFSRVIIEKWNAWHLYVMETQPLINFFWTTSSSTRIDHIPLNPKDIMPLTSTSQVESEYTVDEPLNREPKVKELISRYGWTNGQFSDANRILAS